MGFRYVDSVTAIVDVTALAHRVGEAHRADDGTHHQSRLGTDKYSDLHLDEDQWDAEVFKIEVDRYQRESGQSALRDSTTPPA